MGSVEIFRADELRPNPFLPQRRQFAIEMLIHRAAWQTLKNRRLAIYAAGITLGALKAGRTTIVVEPGFALLMITAKATAASPADGLGSAQAIMYDPARRLAFSTRPVVFDNMSGHGGAGAAPFILRDPYEWTGGAKAPIQIQIQNRANAQNVISLVLIGREP